MKTSDGLTLLRSLLHGTPSPWGWARLCRLLDVWPQGESLELALDYAEAGLRGWPDDVREGPAHWHQAALDGRDGGRWRLVRRLRWPLSDAVDTSLTGALTGAPGEAITHLTVRGALDVEELERAARTGTLGRLTRLDLVATGLEARGALALADARLDRLEHLRVVGGELGARGIAALAAAPWIEGLRRIELRGVGLEAEGIAALGRARALESLAIEAEVLDADAIEALVRWEVARPERVALRHCGLAGRLTALVGSWVHEASAVALGGNQLEGREVEAWLVGTPGQEALELEGAALTPRAIEALCAWGPERLRRLSLNGVCRPGGRRRASLVGMWAAAWRLEVLDLRRAGLVPRELHGLSRATQAQVGRLELGGNPLGDLGVELVASAGLRGLEAIGLEGVDAGARGVERLTRARWWGRVKALELGHNRLLRAGWAALGRGGADARALEVLGLAGTRGDDEGLGALLRPGCWTALRSLSLGENSLWDKGLEALGRWRPGRPLEHLGLGGVRLTARGARGLAAAWPEALGLASGGLDRGAWRALLEAGARGPGALDLRGCRMPEGWAGAMASAPGPGSLYCLALAPETRAAICAEGDERWLWAGAPDVAWAPQVGLRAL